ncbi:SAM-dependent methyltransferase [Salinisphaera sp. Q1T1-3]|uniref:SAM-dependent methyltransferase n=1 Tax=Salinisphaera sp. Q1T1-3 TaxID=2321229 RepID=UPI000E74E7B9|nr:SAM-dependent methyltransferase [Salinisphaera sp. Q1T1-3]RJS94110.1 hypothetical protein D3260_05980 [Salinisphaera sp. Q1T1-3]
MAAPPAEPLAVDYDTVHVAAADHRDALIDELVHRGSRVVATQDDLVFSADRPGPAAWAANTWLAPALYRVESIGAAAHCLKAIQRNWHAHPVGHHRRARLIAERLPTIRFRPLTFPSAPPSAPLGAWTLLSHDRLLASRHTTSAFADGAPAFVEDREGPPNRAYLKLWEALTLAGIQPGPGERCLDLGAAPGGWSWVLAALGARVLAVDRAALAPAVAANARIETRTGDAFSVRGADVGHIDWVCSDLIAYPERLLELARYWCDALPDANIILTVKCQGPVDADLIARFLAIPGARLRHLHANKHELTFFRLRDGGPSEAAGRM